MGETATQLHEVPSEPAQERKTRRVRSDDDKLREILLQKRARVARLRKQLDDAHARVKELEQRLAVEEPGLQQLVKMVGEQPAEQEVVP